MYVLVDTSIWIDYFRGGNNSEHLDLLIDENIILTNDIILAELLPYLHLKKQKNLINRLLALNKTNLIIHWVELIEFQIRCLKKGLNGIGIPDLMIAQNARQNHCKIYSLDKHFGLLNEVLEIDIFN